MRKIKQYRICLADWEGVLPQLAHIIGANYESDSFTKAEERFQNSKEPTVEWIMKGTSGFQISILLEVHESYLFGTPTGEGSTFLKAKEYLQDCYLKQGGNPEV